jgi:hypothetical protein
MSYICNIKLIKAIVPITFKFFLMSIFDSLSRQDRRDALAQWNSEAKDLLKEEGVVLSGNIEKYFMLGYIQDRKDKLDGCHG